MNSRPPLLFDFRHLTVFRGDRRVLRDINLRVWRGEHVAILGPNGCGKSTLIGRALVHDPEALILDEPANSLDPGAAREFRAVLSKLTRAGKSLVLVTHHVSDIIPEIERVILMNNGRIAADGPKAKILTSATLSRLFGKKLRLIRHREHFDLVDA